MDGPPAWAAGCAVVLLAIIVVLLGAVVIGTRPW